jgi:hypothetical protein
MALIKREYIGEGYTHWFRNNDTGELLAIPCSKEEYEAISLPNAKQPTLEGYSWAYSNGGTIKVDSPDGVMREGEYCVKDEKILVAKKDLMNILRIVEDPSINTEE